MTIVMWQSKTCILEMFLDFYGTYSPTEKMNYRDFLKDVFSFYEQNAIGNRNIYYNIQQSEVVSVSGSDVTQRRTSLPGTITAAAPRQHSANIFDLAFSRPALRLEGATNGPPPLPRISGLCSASAAARRNVDIDYSLSTPAENDPEEVVVVEADDSELTSTPLLTARPRASVCSTARQPSALSVWQLGDENQYEGIKMEPQDDLDVGAIKPTGSRAAAVETTPPQLTHSTVNLSLNDSVRSNGQRGQRMKTGQPPQRPHFKCNICNRILSSRNSLNRHKNTKHSCKVNNPLGCDVCGRDFQNRSALVNHLKMHERFGETTQSFQKDSAAVAPVTKPRAKPRKGVRAVKLSGFLSAATSKAVRKRRRTKAANSRAAKHLASIPASPSLPTNEEQSPTKQTPTKQTPTKQSPTKQTPTKQTPTEQSPPAKRRRKRKDGQLKKDFVQRCGIHACRATLYNRDIYLEHIRMFHPEREVLLCDYCERVFLSLKMFRVHQRHHQAVEDDEVTAVETQMVGGGEAVVGNGDDVDDGFFVMELDEEVEDRSGQELSVDVDAVSHT